MEARTGIHQLRELITRGSHVSAVVDLYKALGGGWEMRADKDFVPSDIKAEMKERTNWGDLLSSDKLEYPPAEEVDNLFNRPDW